MVKNDFVAKYHNKTINQSGWNGPGKEGEQLEGISECDLWFLKLWQLLLKEELASLPILCPDNEKTHEIGIGREAGMPKVMTFELDCCCILERLC